MKNNQNISDGPSSIHQTKFQFGVIVHGGAGEIPEKLRPKHEKGVYDACEKSYEILAKGGKAIDAVEIAIKCLENNQVFDAGAGSFFNELGEIEMDAMIATDSGLLGSVCAIQKVKNPISVARKVAEKSPHVMIVGNGALKFAKEHQIPEIDPNELGISPELEMRYQTKDFQKMKKIHDKFGTVGCVCLDKSGHFAIGLSTGGSAMKKQGRVGDTALWGAGGYVSSNGGAAATGDGENLIRILAAYTSINHLNQTKNPQKAAEVMIDVLEKRTNSQGGIIVLSSNGFGFAFNTPKMSVSFRSNQMKKPEIIFHSTCLE